MSFSVNAAGTREEVIDQLNGSAHHHLSAEGHVMRGVLLGYMDTAPASSTNGGPLRYEVTAYGHRSDVPGNVPSLIVSLTAGRPGELSVLPPVAGGKPDPRVPPGAGTAPAPGGTTLAVLQYCSKYCNVAGM